MRITVFGGARPRPGDPAYEDAYRLGKLLGQVGYIVLTGGYIGTMEAVSRGAAEAGAHVIGITCQEIEAWRQVRCNPYVMEEIRYPTLRERMCALIEGCDTALALPGGAGTLAEEALMWNLLITGVISPRPMILIGEGWQSTFGCFFDSLGEYVSGPDRAWLRFTEDIEINSLNFISTISKSGSKTQIPIPFNPNESWGQKEHHYVAGSINGRPFRGSIISDGAHFFLPIGAAWCRDAHLTPGDTVDVTIAPEGPQVDRMSSDIAQALDAEPQARAFFESLATFYRKNYIRWIESAKRPETRQARITELVRLLVAGKKQK